MPIFSQREVFAPSLDFELRNLHINFIGASVSDVNDTFHTTTRDTIYILNKNIKSVFFKDIKFKDAILRDKNLPSNDKNLFTTATRQVRDGDYLLTEYTLQFRGKPVGRLDIWYPYSYYLEQNLLILPFQSFPIDAQYTVIDAGVLTKHYYGQSLQFPNKKTGTLDVNLTVECNTREQEDITEEITISVNLINGGFVDGVPVAVPVPSDQYPVAGTFSHTVCSGCNKNDYYHDGSGGLTTTTTYNPTYCGCTPTPIYVKLFTTTSLGSTTTSTTACGETVPNGHVQSGTTTTYKFYAEADCCTPLNISAMTKPKLNFTYLQEVNSVTTVNTTVFKTPPSTTAYQWIFQTYTSTSVTDPCTDTQNMTEETYTLVSGGTGYQIITDCGAC